jgi:hypothetical protein
MQPTMIFTLASIVCATAAPDSLISLSLTKNGNELPGVSSLTTVLTSLSGFLTKSYYADDNCKTLIYIDGVKLGACVSDSSGSYMMTTVDQNQITETEYDNKDCSTISSITPSVIKYTDSACTTDLTAYRVSATRDIPTPGFMTRSVKKICS